MGILSSIFHPRRAARAMLERDALRLRIEEYESEKSRLEDDNGMLAHKITALEKECAEERRKAELYRRRVLTLEQRLEELVGERDTLQSALDAERKEADMAIEEITGRLEGVEAMRRSYETRLSNLRTALRDTRLRMARQPVQTTAAIPPVINLTDDADDADALPATDDENVTSTSPDSKHVTDTSEPDNWLLPLPG